MSMISQIQNLENMSSQEILNRIRKDVGTSSLTTMNMQLMKHYHVYQKYLRLCDVKKINRQKSTEAIALGLSLMYKELVGIKYKLIPKEVANLLCNQLRDKLLDTLKSKCCRRNRRNPEYLIAVAETYILDDIEILRKILSTDPDDEETVLEFVNELYNHQKSKKKWIKKVTKIFCEERKDEEETRVQQNLLPEEFVEPQEPEIAVPITLQDLNDEDSYSNISSSTVRNLTNDYYRNHHQSNQAFDYFGDSQIFINPWTIGSDSMF